MLDDPENDPKDEHPSGYDTDPKEWRGSYPHRIIDAIFKKVGFRDPEKHPKFVECMIEVSDIFAEVVELMRDEDEDEDVERPEYNDLPCGDSN